MALWFECHVALGQHPKLLKLCRTLDLSKPTAVGHLTYLWWWALQYAMDGNLARFDVDDVADGAQWSGDAQVFIDALVECRFLDEDLSIHDWDDYTGRLVDGIAKYRQANANRQRRFRARHRLEAVPDEPEGGAP